MNAGEANLNVVGVRARVTLESEAEKQEKAARFRESLADDPRQNEVVDNILDPTRYKMFASLSAILSDGRDVSSGVRDMGFSAQNAGISAIAHRYRGPKLSEDPDEHERLLRETYHVSYDDIVDHINQMLGRDPELHKPPRLAWGNLIKALQRAGVHVTEDQLLDTPLELDLSDEVKTEIRLQ
jgi:hypothetical protein